MTRYAGIIGHPVAHSLSPVFQEAAFRACGLDVAYERWDTPPADLPRRIATLRDSRFLGANVTIPHKEAATRLVDEIGDQSARVGALNTIVNRSGRLFGFNTDGPGFVASLRRERGFDPAGRSFLLLGAGGAARGIAFALAGERAAGLTIANRNVERARRLAADVAGASPATPVSATGVPAPVSGFDCIVNCTSVGMEGGGAEGGMPVGLADAAPGALVVDIVYTPAVTPLLAAAEAAGLAAMGGLPMLVYQGALAFELWTGVTAPVEAMFEAARGALALRAHPGGGTAEAT